MLSSLRKRMVALLRDEDGPTATEYAVMFALVILVCMSSIYLLGTSVQGNFTLAVDGW